MPTPTDPESPRVERTLRTVALCLLGAWFVFQALTRPETRTQNLAEAALMLVLVASVWTHKARPRRSTRLAVGLVVVVLVVIALGLWEGHRRARREEVAAASRRAWEARLHSQRAATRLAEKTYQDALENSNRAFQVWSSTARKARAEDGTPGLQATPEATLGIEQATRELQRATEALQAERDREHQLVFPPRR